MQGVIYLKDRISRTCNVHIKKIHKLSQPQKNVFSRLQGYFLCLFYCLSIDFLKKPSASPHVSFEHSIFQNFRKNGKKVSFLPYNLFINYKRSENILSLRALRNLRKSSSFFGK